MESMSLTIPMEPRALRAAAEMLLKMAGLVTAADILAAGTDALSEFNTRAPILPEGSLPAEYGVHTGHEQGPEQPQTMPPTLINEEGAVGPEVFGAPPIVPPMTPDAAPSHHAANVAPVAAAGELDSDGMPWDARIHSSSKAKIVGGEWRLRRNLDPNILAAVTEELKGAAPALPPPPPAGQVPPPPAPVPPPPAAPAGAITSMPQLLAKMTAVGLTKAICTEAAIKLGLKNFAEVATKTHLIPQLAANLGLV